MNTPEQKLNHYLRMSFLIALISTLGSLYFSEVMHFPPCILCWYQRICMYPLVIIFAIGLLREDRAALFYATPLTGLGLGISIYHNLIYWGVIPEALTPCTQGVSCSARFFEYLGFITIPFLSMTAFTLLMGLTLLQFFKWEKK